MFLLPRFFFFFLIAFYITIVTQIELRKDVSLELYQFEKYCGQLWV